MQHGVEAVVITGVCGSGKSSLAQEGADLLEGARRLVRDLRPRLRRLAADVTTGRRDDQAGGRRVARGGNRRGDRRPHARERPPDPRAGDRRRCVARLAMKAPPPRTALLWHDAHVTRAILTDEIRQAITAGHLGRLTCDPRVALSVEAEGANPIGRANCLIMDGTARSTEGGAPGHVIPITPERIGGIGPWAT